MGFFPYSGTFSSMETGIRKGWVNECEGSTLVGWRAAPLVKFRQSRCHKALCPVDR